MALIAETETVAKKKDRWMPMGDKIVVKPFTPEEQTVSGIWLPPVAQEKQSQGTVIGVGKGRYDSGFFIPNKLRIGDVILFSKQAGYDFKIDGEWVTMMRESDAMAVRLDDDDERFSDQDPGMPDQPTE